MLTYTPEICIQDALVCKIPLLARRTRPSARATIGYLVYKRCPIVALALGLAAAFRPSASREQMYLAYKPEINIIHCHLKLESICMVFKQIQVIIWTFFENGRLTRCESFFARAVCSYEGVNLGSFREWTPYPL